MNAGTLTISETGQVELFTAYAKAQASMGAVVKAANNPAFRSKYADLATVIDAVLPPMNAAGLAVIQSPSFDGETVTVETFIAHTGGGWLRSALSMRPTKSDPQGVGSATTYARRYALLSLAGVAPEDDDGNAASGDGRGGNPFRAVANEPQGETSRKDAMITEIEKLTTEEARMRWIADHTPELTGASEETQTAVRSSLRAQKTLIAGRAMSEAA